MACGSDTPKYKCPRALAPRLHDDACTVLLLLHTSMSPSTALMTARMNESCQNLPELAQDACRLPGTHVQRRMQQRAQGGDWLLRQAREGGVRAAGRVH